MRLTLRTRLVKPFGMLIKHLLRSWQVQIASSGLVWRDRRRISLPGPIQHCGRLSEIGRKYQQPRALAVWCIQFPIRAHDVTRRLRYLDIGEDKTACRWSVLADDVKTNGTIAHIPIETSDTSSSRVVPCSCSHLECASTVGNTNLVVDKGPVPVLGDALVAALQLAVLNCELLVS